MKMWANVDKPLMTITIHSDGGCAFERAKKTTPRKTVGDLGIDGGWLAVASVDEGKALAASPRLRKFAGQSKRAWATSLCTKC